MNDRNQKQTQAAFFFLGVIFIFVLAPVSRLLSETVDSDALEAQTVDRKLAKIEEQVRRIQENEKRITSKHQEIKSELDNLKIWINRRR